MPKEAKTFAYIFTCSRFLCSLLSATLFDGFFFTSLLLQQNASRHHELTTSGESILCKTLFVCVCVCPIACYHTTSHIYIVLLVKMPTQIPYKISLDGIFLSLTIPICTLNKLKMREMVFCSCKYQIQWQCIHFINVIIL